jgi:stage III sporulation protein AG
VDLFTNVAKWWRESNTADSRTRKALFNLSPSQGRKAKLTALLLVIGLLLLVYSKPYQESPVPPNFGSDTSQLPVLGGERLSPDYHRKLEDDLASILNQIHGVGQVRVLITLDGGKKEYLADTNKEVRTTIETDRSGGQREIREERTTNQVVIVRDDARRGEQPVLLWEGRPIIQGVLVVADGAMDSRIKLQILRAVETALAIAPHKIQVMPKR